MSYKAKVLELAAGGTNAALTAANGGIFYSSATAAAILAPTSTANQPLLSGASGAPGWSTATYPGATTINQLLYSSAANTIVGLATANNGTLVTSSAGVPSILAGPGTTGNILQSNAAAAPSFSTATYPSIATGTGTILRADGTNWVATTATYPATATVSQILYASATNVISGLATANGGVLTTSSSGVPSIDTTNFSVLSTGVQMKGNNTNTAPPAGFIGEQIKSSVALGSAITLSTGTAANITSVNLTAGIWDLSLCAGFNGTVTGIQYIIAISANSASFTGVVEDGSDRADTPTSPTVNSQNYLTIPKFRVALSGSATYYAVANSSFTVGTLKVFGTLTATRVG